MDNTLEDSLEPFMDLFLTNDPEPSQLAQPQKEDNPPESLSTNFFQEAWNDGLHDSSEDGLLWDVLQGDSRGLAAQAGVKDPLSEHVPSASQARDDTPSSSPSTYISDQSQSPEPVRSSFSSDAEHPRSILDVKSKEAPGSNFSPHISKPMVGYTASSERPVHRSHEDPGVGTMSSTGADPRDSCQVQDGTQRALPHRLRQSQQPEEPETCQASEVSKSSGTQSGTEVPSQALRPVRHDRSSPDTSAYLPFEHALLPHHSPHLYSGSSSSSWPYVSAPHVVANTHHSSRVPISLQVGALTQDTKTSDVEGELQCQEVKSIRVENYFNFAIKIGPLSPTVKRLKMQPNNLLPEFLRSNKTDNSLPDPSPDMLQLYMAVVCTSYLATPEGHSKALQDAATGICYNGETELPEGTLKTEAGLVVQCCKKCTSRELPRVNRRKGWTEDHTRTWNEIAKTRVLCLDHKGSQDYVDIHRPYLNVVADGKSQLAKKYGPANMANDGMLELRMRARILCYTGHAQEAEGYNIIFTVKDRLGNVLTQGLSKPIKVVNQKPRPPKSDCQATAPVTPSDVSPFGFGGVQVPCAFPGPTRHHHHFSAPNLQEVASGAYSQWSHTDPLSPPYTPTLGTLTPDVRSRPASPGYGGGSTTKRRRPNGTSAPSHHRNSSSISFASLHRHSSNVQENLPNFTPPFVNVQERHGVTPGQYNGAFPSNSSALPHRSHLDNYTGNAIPIPHANHSQFPNHPEWGPSNGYQPRISPHSATMRSSAAPSSSPQSSTPSDHGQNGPQSGNSLTGPQSFTSPTSNRPTIRAFKCQPNQGEVGGGNFIEIYGQGFFQKIDTILFGTLKAQDVHIIDSTRLICKPPPAIAPQSVPVTIDCEGAQSDAMYTYIDNTVRNQNWLMFLIHNQKANGNMFGAVSGTNPVLPAANVYPDPNFAFIQGGGYSRENTESSLMDVLELIDMDDSPHVADFDLQGPGGQGLLHLAAFKGQYRLTSGLLARGANPDLRDLNGMTPMHLASMQKHSKIVRKLRACGADPGLRSLAGHMPVDMAPDRETLRLFEDLENQLPSSLCPMPLSISRRGSVASRQPSRERSMHENFIQSPDQSIEGDDSSDITGSLYLPTMAATRKSRQNSMGVQIADEHVPIVPDEKMFPTYMDGAQMMHSLQRTLAAVQDAVQNFQAPGLATQVQNIQAALQCWPLSIPPFPVNLRPTSPNLLPQEVLRRWQQSWASGNADAEAKIKGRSETGSGKMLDALGSIRDRIPSFGLSPPAYDEVCPAQEKSLGSDLKLRGARPTLSSAELLSGATTQAEPGPSKTNTTTAEKVSSPPPPKAVQAGVRHDKRFLFWWLPMFCILVFILLGPSPSTIQSIMRPVWPIVRNLLPGDDHRALAVE